MGNSSSSSNETQKLEELCTTTYCSSPKKCIQAIFKVYPECGRQCCDNHICDCNLYDIMYDINGQFHIVCKCCEAIYNNQRNI